MDLRERCWELLLVFLISLLVLGWTIPCLLLTLLTLGLVRLRPVRDLLRLAAVLVVVLFLSVVHIIRPQY